MVDRWVDRMDGWMGGYVSAWWVDKGGWMNLESHGAVGWDVLALRPSTPREMVYLRKGL